MPVRLAQNPGPPSLSNASQGKKVDSRRENLSQILFKFGKKAKEKQRQRKRKRKKK